MDNDLYDDYLTYNRRLVSRDLDGISYVLPENTTITMLDMITNTTYYYIVTDDDVDDDFHCCI